LRVVFYSNERERITLLRQAHNNTERCIHQDFIDINGNPTDGTKGRLTIEDYIAVLDPELIERTRLIAKINDNTATITDLRKYLKIRDGI